MNDFSVVICTYADESADFLSQALESIINQSVRPSEIVLVLDGPVPENQHMIISRFLESYPHIVNVLSLETNIGRGEARNMGVRESQHDLVAIMDSDDIAYPYRFEEQLKLFNKRAVDIVIGWQTEFLGTPDNVVATKECPHSHDEVISSLKFRCRIPNPTIIFKKDVFERVGGYADFKQINEDHDLFIKLACYGARFGVINKPLINVRISPEQRRRRGLKVLGDDYSFRWSLFRRGYYSLAEFFWYFSAIAVFRLLPISLKNIFYALARSKAA